MMASKPQHQKCPVWGSLNVPPTPRLSAAKADRAQFKPKLLVGLAKVSSRHVPQRQKAHSGRAELQEGFRLSLPELTAGRQNGELVGGQPRPLPTLASPCPSPYPAAVIGDSDGGWCHLVERQLFSVGSKEPEGAAVVPCSFVQPGGRVLAGVGEALAGRGTQQLQEGHLDHTHRGPISIHVGELGVEQSRR